MQDSSVSPFVFPAEVSSHELVSQRERGQAFHLVDVRTPAEFGEVHAEGAVNVPLDRIDAATVRERCGDFGPHQPVVLICRSGSRAKLAADRLRDAGCDAVSVLLGGTEAWERAGLPVSRGRKAISLERQVRIAAGTLVLLGSVLGLTVHPAFVGLAAFVGAGLLFSGVTDTCGMALLLARMPWNQMSCGEERCCR